MNKVATLGLAFLLVFSGCLGLGDDELPNDDDTVEPMGETDLESLEKDMDMLKAKLELLEASIDNATLDCEMDQIPRYDAENDVWVCSDDRTTHPSGHENLNVRWVRDLSGADLSGTNLSGEDLRDADLSGANLRYSDLRYSDLRDADLTGADQIGRAHV